MANGLEIWTTPKGTFSWVVINDGVGNKAPNGEPTGTYDASLRIDKADAEALKQKALDFFKESKEGKELEGKVDLSMLSIPVHEKTDKNSGEVYYEVKTRIPIKKKDKQGNETERTITILDGHRNELPADTKVNFGSKGRIIFLPHVWKTMMGAGVSFKLLSLQVTKFATGGGSYADYVPIDVEDEEDEDEEVVF